MNIFLIALIAGLSGMLGWGISDFFAKKTIDKIGDLKTLIGSQIIGGLFLLLYFLYTKSPVPQITLNGLLYVFALSALDGTAYLLLYRSFQKGIMSVVSPIASSCAGFAVIVSTLLFRETLTIMGLIGVTTIFAGVIITSTNFGDIKKNFSKVSISKGVPEAFIFAIIIGFWYPLWDKFVGGSRVGYFG